MVTMKQRREGGEEGEGNEGEGEGDRGGEGGEGGGGEGGDGGGGAENREGSPKETHQYQLISLPVNAPPLPESPEDREYAIPFHRPLPPVPNALASPTFTNLKTDGTGERNTNEYEVIPGE